MSGAVVSIDSTISNNRRLVQQRGIERADDECPYMYTSLRERVRRVHFFFNRRDTLRRDDKIISLFFRLWPNLH